MDWRNIRRQNITDWKYLLYFLEIEEAKQEAILAKPRFPLNLPMRLAQKMEKNNLNDPLFKQFVPLEQETVAAPGFVEDPVQDVRFMRGKKLLQKYRGRALLLASSACAMNCRFCFRQNFPYETEEKGFHEELEEIRKDPSLSEIILSGGDPLSLMNGTLEKLIADLEEIPHLKLLRFHTRFPVGIPERIDSDFLKLLEKTRLQVTFIIHTNHPSELDKEVLEALKRVQKLGIPLLAHSVLLKEVNDDFHTLKALFEKLIQNGILPYYLNLLDPVQGTAHFFVEKEKGKSLLAELAAHLPGYAIPRFAQELPGAPHKTLI